jgi:hypothetical protein
MRRRDSFHFAQWIGMCLAAILFICFCVGMCNRGYGVPNWQIAERLGRPIVGPRLLFLSLILVMSSMLIDVVKQIKTGEAYAKMGRYSQRLVTRWDNPKEFWSATVSGFLVPAIIITLVLWALIHNVTF